MKNFNVKIKNVLVVKIMLCIVAFIMVAPFQTEAKAATNNNYLVLVQNKDLNWTVYENMVEKSPQGNLMIKAASISEALNLTYTMISDEKFIIQRGYYRNNTYTLGRVYYTFKSSSSLTNLMKTKGASYSSEEGYNMCHINTLATLVNYQYYTGSKAINYRNKGYKGVVCYSIYGAITEVPSMNKVVTKNQVKFFPEMGLGNQNEITSGDDAIPEFPENKLIVVGDSRINNMSKWVATTVNTEFVAKSGKGFQWFVDEGINQVNSIINPGDVILVWLGVNDYFSMNLGGDTVLTYANKINSLAVNEWKDCKVFVAEVGYVDTNLIYNYYGEVIRANVTPLVSGNQISGIKNFNEYLSMFLSNQITWIGTNELIGIEGTDFEITPEEIWLMRDNGLKDGLHYGITTSIELYQYFVEQTMYN